MSRGPVKAASVFWLLLGCAGPGMVGLRPDGTPGPEPCPPKSLETMALLRLHLGESSWVNIDMNQHSDENIVVNDGPIESGLRQELGPLDAGTRLYGKVWTGGPHVVIRYYEAHPLDPGIGIPICAVARLSEGQLRKLPGPAPGSAVLQYSVAAVVIVQDFR